MQRGRPSACNEGGTQHAMREAIRMYWGLCEQQRECTLNLVASFTSRYSQSEAIRGTQCTLGLVASFASRVLSASSDRR